MSVKLTLLAVTLWAELCVGVAPATSWAFDNYMELETPSTVALTITPGTGLTAVDSDTITITASPSGWPISGQHTVTTDHSSPCTYDASTNSDVTTITITGLNTDCDLPAGAARVLSFNSPFLPNPPYSTTPATLSTVTSQDTTADVITIPIEKAPTSPSTSFTFSSLKPLELLTSVVLQLTPQSALSQSEIITISSVTPDWPILDAAGAAVTTVASCESIPWTKSGNTGPIVLVLPNGCSLSPAAPVEFTFGSGVGTNPIAGTYLLTTTTTNDASPSEASVVIGDVPTPSPTPVPEPSPSPSAGAAATPSIIITGLALLRMSTA